jgi:hypothetical protein
MSWMRVYITMDDVFAMAIMLITIFSKMNFLIKVFDPGGIEPSTIWAQNETLATASWVMNFYFMRKIPYKFYSFLRTTFNTSYWGYMWSRSFGCPNWWKRGPFLFEMYSKRRVTMTFKNYKFKNFSLNESKGIWVIKTRAKFDQEIRRNIPTKHSFPVCSK